jgi:hypothetical protein
MLLLDEPESAASRPRSADAAHAREACPSFAYLRVLCAFALN